MWHHVPSDDTALMLALNAPRSPANVADSSPSRKHREPSLVRAQAMHLKVSCTAAVVLLLSCPVVPQALLPDHHQHPRHFPDVEVGHKALFTLGALAVLGGASYYIGRHMGMKDVQQHGLLSYGYPSGYSYGHFNPYGHYAHGAQYGHYAHGAQYGHYGHGAQYGHYGHGAQYGQYKHKPFKGGFRAGVYAAPLLYSRRRKREAVPDKHMERINSLDDNLAVTIVQQGGSSCRHSNQNIPVKVPEMKNTVVNDPKRNEITTKMNENEGLAFKKKERTRRAAHRPTLVVTSQPISVSDDPYTSNRVELLSSKVPKHDMKLGLKLRPEPRAPVQEHYNLHSRLKNARVVAIPQVTPETQDENPKRFRARRPEDRQQLLCDDDSQARNFEQFELLMLESALAEDDNGCGLSLVCEIGRMPLHLLPLKAMGLRRLLTGTKPRGLDGVVWGALTESLLGGLSGNDCSQRHHYCTTPPAQLMRIFASL
ncbi:hypothetical protein FHG87_006365 [Trinorchestia longiramus]|nr:hypothetical protein FHG87_006365 [Trinorchestia longiramus]